MTTARTSKRRRLRCESEADASALPRFEMLEPRLLLAANVVINELHIDPPIATEMAEYIELHNSGDTAADVSGWYFDSGVEFIIPDGTTIAAGGHLVIAQDPTTVQVKFGVAAIGPWIGRLANEGERIVLRDKLGAKIDEVDYGQGFPWPTVGSDAGYSLELIHPALDNDLGGSWRSSQGTDSGDSLIFDAQGTWQYMKGTAEPSVTTGAWRQLGFNDASWLTGTTAIGYGESFINTVLADMSGNYTTVYLRQTFVVDDPAAFESLLLEAQYDDGINVWINGTRVAWANVAGENLPRTATAGTAIENINFVPFNIANASSLLHAGTNVIAVQLVNASINGSSDAFFDARLTAEIGRPPGATPGAINSVFAANAPPQMRQVDHHSGQPTSNEAVTITVKVTDSDGVASVSLDYQIVEPGDYIALTDPRYQTQWTTLVMRDDGLAGDLVAGDDVYTAVIPGDVQQHRRLIRYRINSEDSLGATVRGPYSDDPQPNFAYFVYDGVPDWSGAIQPGSSNPARAEVKTFTSDLLNTLPTYHLITTSKSHADSQFIPDSSMGSGYTGSDYLWEGTFVYDGVVYDHVEFRARGGVWRYAMGKNMWKFNFTRGHSLEARDNYGELYETAWDKLNLSAVIQQGDYLHRGEQGLFESVGFQLFNLADVESPDTHFIQFRIIDSADESPASQYGGDFQGLYLAIEQPDGRLLEAHDLPDGNLYKMEGGTGTLNNQGPTQPSDRSDLDAFQAGYNAAGQSDQWFRDNLDLDRYYSYRSIVEAIHHYDIAAGKNYYFYHNPETDQWSTHPWDLDLTWANNMFGNGAEPFRDRVLTRDAFAVEYRNRMREVLDLLYNIDQAGMLIDEMAQWINTPVIAGGPTMVDADRAMWDHNPILRSPYVNGVKSGNGRYYQASATGDFEGMIVLMKSYITSRTNWIMQNILVDEDEIPQTPTIDYSGPAAFPLNQLSFDVSPFISDDASFAAMQWRVAEVTDTTAPDFDPLEERAYEIDATWDSGQVTQQLAEITVDGAALKAGRTYRVRVRMLDDQGRFSHWSDAVQFVAGPAASQAIDSLRITELHYNPPAPALPDATDPQLFEFVELTNFGPGTIDLAGVRFTRGITYDFTQGGIASLAPGQRIVLARNLTAFASRYDTTGLTIVTGYTGTFDNGGERITLVDAGGGVIHDFTYDDGDDWPALADGAGATLEIIDPDGNYNDADNWRPSSIYDGSPGTAAETANDQVAINEVLSHTDLPLRDAIELYNRSDHSIDLSGWFLSDSSNDYRKYRFPNGSMLAAGAYLVLDENDFNPGLGTNLTDFSFNAAHGDDAYLMQADPITGALLRFVDVVSFGAQANGESWGRVPDGTGPLVPMQSRTLGGANSDPRIGPILISEVHYNPLDPGNLPVGVIAQDLEFIEIHNPTSGPVVLNQWRISGGIEFEFLPGAMLSAGQSLIVVSFNPNDPADATKLAAFVNHYALNESTIIVGSYSGQLSNSGETVRLERPDEPPSDEPDFTPRLFEDEVSWDALPPWPATPNGIGDSLRRNLPVSLGSLASSWTAAAANPGAVTQAPRVVSVAVASTGWSPAFLHELDLLGLGQGGFTVSTGANQLQPIAWLNLNQIIITFSASIIVEQMDLLVMGVNSPRYTFSDFAYDTATFTAMWTLAGVMDADKLLLHLADNVRNSAGKALDGEWSSGASTQSGDGSAGGDFLFRLNTLPGDVNHSGIVHDDDINLVRDASLSMAGTTAYNPRLDVNGSGSVRIDDVILTRNQRSTALPAGEPDLDTTTPIAQVIVNPIEVDQVSVSPIAKMQRSQQTLASIIRLQDVANALQRRDESRLLSYPAIATFVLTHRDGDQRDLRWKTTRHWLLSDRDWLGANMDVAGTTETG